VTFLIPIDAPSHVLQRINGLAMGRKTNIEPRTKSETIKAFKLSSQHSAGVGIWICTCLGESLYYRIDQALRSAIDVTRTGKNTSCPKLKSPVVQVPHSLLSGTTHPYPP